jgi:lipopolysaccharide/colanic/teichoic acid biosynthesis glycosyltransferase
MAYPDTLSKIADHQSSTESGNSLALAKRIFDLAFVVLMLPAVLPIILVLYVLTRLDGGPGFFGHVRVGKDNRDFRCWKIRSMVLDAEKVLEDYLAMNPEAAAEWDRDFKLSDDPRVTRLGRFLRSSSLDELPQIWNVICGEMSFVGPRPVTRKEMVKYEGHEKSYLSLKPGITGLWQVSGRNDVSYEERVRLDTEYFNTQTLMMDVEIILKTAGAVLKRTGR